MNKKYNFESVQSNNSAEAVELHQKHRSFHILAKITCFLLAVVFWLLMSGLESYREKLALDGANDLPEVQETNVND
ncbi:MAG: hypothetical protein IJW97_03610 [Clostridia bacterium]|nr:hypothetical protein [Clostridia bacterium]